MNTFTRLTEDQLRTEVIAMVRQYPDGTRIRDLETELVVQGFEFAQVDLRAAVWSLIAIRKLELSPESIITVRTPEE